MIQFWPPFFWSACWSLQQTSWPFFIVLILRVDCPFSELTSVPVCPTLTPVSGGRFSTGNDCQGLTFLPSCPGLLRWMWAHHQWSAQPPSSGHISREVESKTPHC